MAGEQIFIVEDERIVAEDLKRMLERLGYKVVGSESSGDEAIKKIATAKPQLMLLDIRIQGSIDGIDVAEHVVAELDIPVIYLTAYADETTVDRAKGTLPAGYILKPFEEQSLKTAIELALYRHHMQRMVANFGELHGGILENLNVPVVAIDTHRKVIYLNKKAEGLTGHLLDNAFGKVFEDICSFEKTACKESTINDLEGHVIGTALVLPTTTP